MADADLDAMFTQVGAGGGSNVTLKVYGGSPFPCAMAQVAVVAVLLAYFSMATGCRYYVLLAQFTGGKTPESKGS